VEMHTIRLVAHNFAKKKRDKKRRNEERERERQREREREREREKKERNITWPGSPVIPNLMYDSRGCHLLAVILATPDPPLLISSSWK